MVKDAFSLLMYLQAMDLCLMIGCIQANVASSLHFLPTFRGGLVWAGLGWVDVTAFSERWARTLFGKDHIFSESVIWKGKWKS